MTKHYNKKNSKYLCGLYCAFKQTVSVMINVVYVFTLQRAVEKGAVVVQAPSDMSDKDGTVRFCVVQTFGDTTHTLIDLSNYKGHYLPGYQTLDPSKDPMVEKL